MKRHLLAATLISIFLSACQVDVSEEDVNSLSEPANTNPSTSSDASGTKPIPQELVGIWSVFPEKQETYISISKDGIWMDISKENIDESRKCFWHEASTIQPVSGNQYRLTTEKNPDGRLIKFIVQNNQLTVINDTVFQLQLTRAEFAEESRYTPICEEQLTIDALSGIWRINQENSMETYLSIHSNGMLTEYVYDQSDLGSGQNCYWKTEATVNNQGRDKYSLSYPLDSINSKTVGYYSIVSKENKALNYIDFSKEPYVRGVIPASSIQEENQFSPICSTATSLSEIVGVWEIQPNTDFHEDGSLAEAPIGYFTVQSNGASSFYNSNRSEGQDVCYYQSPLDKNVWQLTDLGNSQYKVQISRTHPIDLIADISQQQRQISINFAEGPKFLNFHATKTDIPAANQITPICPFYP